MKSGGELGLAEINAAVKMLSDNGVRCVIVGGAAMCLHGLRDATNDIDIWTRDPIGVTELMKRNLPSIMFDVTNDPYIWGGFDVSPGDNSVTACGTVQVLDKPTLFAVKSDTGRSKDISDLELLAGSMPQEDVLERISGFTRNNKDRFLFFAEHVLLEIQASYMTPISREMLDSCNLDSRFDSMLAESFGVEQRSAACYGSHRVAA